MASFADEADHWRERAEQMIAYADQAKDPKTQDTFLNIAAAYERLAELAETVADNALRHANQRGLNAQDSSPANDDLAS